MGTVNTAPVTASLVQKYFLRCSGADSRVMIDPFSEDFSRLSLAVPNGAHTSEVLHPGRPLALTLADSWQGADFKPNALHYTMFRCRFSVYVRCSQFRPFRSRRQGVARA